MILHAHRKNTYTFFYELSENGLHRVLYIEGVTGGINCYAARVHNSSSCNGRSEVCGTDYSGSTDMPMKVKYTVLDGEIISENRGGTISDYVPDSLGSTRFLLNSSHTPTDSWNYWPYGESVRLTGTNPTPMLFVGALSYHQDNGYRTQAGLRASEQAKARWLTEIRAVCRAARRIHMHMLMAILRASLIWPDAVRRAAVHSGTTAAL